MPFSSTSDTLTDFVCIKCHRDAIRVVSSIDVYLYLRCDCCGDVSMITERRRDSGQSQPGQSPPPTPRLRRVTDLPAVPPQ